MAELNLNLDILFKVSAQSKDKPSTAETHNRLVGLEFQQTLAKYSEPSSAPPLVSKQTANLPPLKLNHRLQGYVSLPPYHLATKPHQESNELLSEASAKSLPDLGYSSVSDLDKSSEFSFAGLFKAFSETSDSNQSNTSPTALNSLLASALEFSLSQLSQNQVNESFNQFVYSRRLSVEIFSSPMATWPVSFGADLQSEPELELNTQATQANLAAPANPSSGKANKNAQALPVVFTESVSVFFSAAKESEQVVLDTTQALLVPDTNEAVAASSEADFNPDSENDAQESSFFPDYFALPTFFGEDLPTEEFALNFEPALRTVESSVFVNAFSYSFVEYQVIYRAEDASEPLLVPVQIESRPMNQLTASLFEVMSFNQALSYLPAALEQKFSRQQNESNQQEDFDLLEDIDLDAHLDRFIDQLFSSDSNLLDFDLGQDLKLSIQDLVKLPPQSIQKLDLSTLLNLTNTDNSVWSEDESFWQDLFNTQPFLLPANHKKPEYKQDALAIEQPDVKTLSFLNLWGLTQLFLPLIDEDNSATSELAKTVSSALLLPVPSVEQETISQNSSDSDSGTSQSEQTSQAEQTQAPVTPAPVAQPEAPAVPATPVVQTQAPVTPTPVAQPEAPAVPAAPVIQTQAPAVPAAPVVQTQAPATPAPVAQPEAPAVPATPVVQTQAPATPAPVAQPEAPAVPATPVVQTQAPATPAPAAQPEAPAVPAAPVVQTQAPAVPAAPVVQTQAPATPAPAAQPEAPAVPAAPVVQTQAPAVPAPVAQPEAPAVPATPVVQTQAPATPAPVAQPEAPAVPATPVVQTQAPAAPVVPSLNSLDLPQGKVSIPEELIEKALNDQLRETDSRPAWMPLPRLQILSIKLGNLQVRPAARQAESQPFYPAHLEDLWVSSEPMVKDVSQLNTSDEDAQTQSDSQNTEDAKPTFAPINTPLAAAPVPFKLEDLFAPPTPKEATKSTLTTLNVQFKLTTLNAASMASPQATFNQYLTPELAQVMQQVESFIVKLAEPALPRAAQNIAQTESTEVAPLSRKSEAATTGTSAVNAAPLTASQVIYAANNNIPVHIADFPAFVNRVIQTLDPGSRVVQSFEITLRPSDMGQVTAQFSMTNQHKVMITLYTQSAATAQTLESCQKEVQHIVSQTQLTLGQMVVKQAVAPARPGMGGQNSAGQGQGQQGTSANDASSRRRHNQRRRRDSDNLSIDVTI